MNDPKTNQNADVPVIVTLRPVLGEEVGNLDRGWNVDWVELDELFDERTGLFSVEQREPVRVLDRSRQLVAQLAVLVACAVGLDVGEDLLCLGGRDVLLANLLLKYRHLSSGDSYGRHGRSVSSSCRRP